MCEEACEVAQLTLLKPMYALILTGKEVREPVTIDFEQVTEALSNMTIEGEVGAVLHTAFDNHVAKLYLLPRSDLQLEQLVAAFFKLDGGHDDQVDCLTQLNQIFFRKVLNFLHITAMHD